MTWPTSNVRSSATERIILVGRYDNYNTPRVGRRRPFVPRCHDDRSSRTRRRFHCNSTIVLPDGRTIRTWSRRSRLLGGTSGVKRLCVCVCVCRSLLCRRSELGIIINSAFLVGFSFIESFYGKRVIQYERGKQSANVKVDCFGFSIRAMNACEPTIC